jgi:hypothetical protein
VGQNITSYKRRGKIIIFRNWNFMLATISLIEGRRRMHIGYWWESQKGGDN